MELPRGGCADGQCRGREEPPAAGRPSAPLGLGAAEPWDTHLQHQPWPAGQPLSRKPSETAGLIGCSKASWCTRGPAAWGLQGHPSYCQWGKLREAAAPQLPGQQRGREGTRRERPFPQLDTLLRGRSHFVHLLATAAAGLLALSSETQTCRHMQTHTGTLSPTVK